MEKIFNRTNHPNIYHDPIQGTYVVLTAFGNWVHFNKLELAQSYRDTSRDMQDSMPNSYFEEKIK